MKNIKLEQLPSGSYRIRKMINGKRVQIVFDHKPTQTEIIKAMSNKADATPVKMSFLNCASAYIESKSHVLSPATVRGYESIMRNLPDTFTHKRLSQISQIDIDAVINEYAADHSPKSTRNAHGFISCVLRRYCPDMHINTTLPQKTPKSGYIPSKNDIIQILDASKGTCYHIPFQLGCMGLRLSEICALTLDDISHDDNTLTINKALVKDKYGKYVLKGTKTENGTRVLYCPDALINEIFEKGTIYDGHPNCCLKALNRYQDKMGIPRFRFHDLRHFFASYSHSQGVSDADIMASGGWKSDHVMKAVYRHEMQQKEAQKKIFDSLLVDSEKIAEK
jgi:integrase